MQFSQMAIKENTKIAPHSWVGRNIPFYSPQGASEVRFEMLVAWHSKPEGYFFLKIPINLLHRWGEILFWNLPSEVFLWKFPLIQSR